jgi:hypothetical protein
MMILEFPRAQILSVCRTLCFYAEDQESKRVQSREKIGYKAAKRLTTGRSVNLISFTSLKHSVLATSQGVEGNVDGSRYKTRYPC